MAAPGIAAGLDMTVLGLPSSGESGIERRSCNYQHLLRFIPQSRSQAGGEPKAASWNLAPWTPLRSARGVALPSRPWPEYAMTHG